MQLSYDRRWWWSLSEIDLLPFPARWTLRSPVGAWCLLFWSAALAAVASAAAQGTAAHLALIVAGVEGIYALLHLGRKTAPLDPSFPGSILAFGLWHNAVLEELIFRGIPLVVGAVTGLSAHPFWPYLYIGGTALAFGVHHRRMGQPERFYDTTLFGALLAAVALRYGLPAAILLHSIHNARSLPLGHADPSLCLWRLNRHLYVAALTLVGLWRLVPK
jgi:hypothetical protein